MSEEYKYILETSLWRIANILRGRMNADEYRNYILGLIFYKFLSDKLLTYVNDILVADAILYTDIQEDTEEGNEYLEAIRESCLTALGYYLKPSQLFNVLVEKGKSEQFNTNSKYIIENLGKVFTDIESSTQRTESEDDFKGLFRDLDLNSQKLGDNVYSRNKVLTDIMILLDPVDFKLDELHVDILGDAYEYLISQFASSAGKKAGEFYTPQQVSKILARIVSTGKSQLKSVYDPTCGSGSLLLRVAKETIVNEFYGQESNPTTYNLARMNMMLHGIHFRNFDIQNADSLENPKHIDMKFEAIVANPPFSIAWSANQLFMSDDRFSQAGKLPPASKADYAFVQHMIHHLAENGVMAVVLPHGALFRGASEGHIRRYLIEDKNYLDAVIGLPSNVFYGTGIPTCILVFKKCREHPKDILFIDASQYYEKIKTQNFLRNEDVKRIIDTYRERKTVEKFSYVASLKEIEENDYNLNIPRYVDNGEEEEVIDLDRLSHSFVEIEEKIANIDSILLYYCKELGIPAPFRMAE